MVNCNKSHRQNLQSITPATHGLILRKASSIQPERVNWLWPNRIPRGMLTLVAGRGGVGKSTIALSIAAIVTTGGKWPLSDNSADPADVLIMTAEDRLGCVMIPRLMAADANRARVHFLEGVNRNVKRPDHKAQFSISRDAERLSQALAQNPAIKLVIIDPLSAFLDVNDAHRDADVRQALGPLTQVADQHDVAVLLIAHLNKGQGRDARERVSGSSAIVNAVRMAYLVHEDGDDQRLFVQFKANVSPHRRGLVYRIEGRPWNERGDEIGCVIWVEETSKDANSILAADEKSPSSAPQRKEAEQFLTQLLAEGPVESNAVFAQGKECGVSRSTLYRAKEALKIKAVKDGFVPGWSWTLPDSSRVR